MSAAEVMTPDAQASQAPGAAEPVSFRTDPGKYRHWRLEIDGEVAWLVLDVDPRRGCGPGTS